MLDTNMKTQLKAYLEKLTKPVELIATQACHSHSAPQTANSKKSASGQR